MPMLVCQPKRARYPLVGAVRANEILLGASFADTDNPESEACDGDDSEPGGSEFAVEASGVSEVEVAVQVADPGAQRRGAAGAVDDEVAADLSGAGVDEHGPGLARSEAVFGIHNPCRVARLGCRTHGEEAGRIATVGVGSLDLRCEGERRLGLGCVQLLCVDGLFELRGEGVEGAADGGDEDERSDEDPGVEVQSEQ